MDFSVFVTSSTPFIDRRLWGLWLLGLSTRQAESTLLEKGSSESLISFAAIQTQFRVFETLEPFLHRPKTLHSQLLLPLPVTTRGLLIQSYYSFDERVVREILGRKLTSRARKELEDIVSKTRIPIGGCRRMFDNLKRVSKRLEDSGSRDMVCTIKTDFLLSQELAEQYANILFINHYRLDTGKRRIAYLRFSDFVYMASVFIEHLTDRNSGGGGPLDELDALIAADSRDLKYLLFASKETLEEYRGLVGMQLTSLGLGNIMERAAGQAFKTLIRYCLGLGAGLVHTKELKDLFVNLQEKIVEPCVALGWASTDLDDFFKALIDQFPNLTILEGPSVTPQQKKRLTESYGRLMGAIKTASGRMLSSFTAAASR